MLLKNLRKNIKRDYMIKGGDEVLDPKNEDSSGHRDEGNDSRLVSIAQHFSGPMPPPDVLAGYGYLIPDAPERILQMAENQQTHRIHLERTVVESSLKRSNLGLRFAFIIAILMIGGGIYLVAMGQNIEGFAAILIPLASIIGSFIISRRDARSELAASQGTPAPKPEASRKN